MCRVMFWIVNFPFWLSVVDSLCREGQIRMTVRWGKVMSCRRRWVDNVSLLYVSCLTGEENNMYLSGGGSLTHVILTVSPSITVLLEDVIFIETFGSGTQTLIVFRWRPYLNHNVSAKKWLFSPFESLLLLKFVMCKWKRNYEEREYEKNVQPQIRKKLGQYRKGNKEANKQTTIINNNQFHVLSY